MNLSHPLIGLGGKLRSGKDVVADRLVAEHGYVKLGMSDALHEAMLAIDPIITVEKPSPFDPYRRERPVRYSTLIERHGYVGAKQNPEVRRLLQNLGTEVGRNMIDVNVWVNIMARKIDDHRAAGRPVVVTGIRFANEIQMIADLNGNAIWIDRPGTEAPTAGTASHASENSVSAKDFDFTLSNDGTLAQLLDRADDIAETFTLSPKESA